MSGPGWLVRVSSWASPSVLEQNGLLLRGSFWVGHRELLRCSEQSCGFLWGQRDNLHRELATQCTHFPTCCLLGGREGGEGPLVSDSSGGGMEGSPLANLASSLMPLMNCLMCPEAEGFMSSQDVSPTTMAHHIMHIHP